jgi:hypothetical protein
LSGEIRLAAARSERNVRVKVVVWNMDFKRADKNWDKFNEGGELACDIALLNEGTPPPPDLRPKVKTEGKTVGRDDVTHGGKKTREWATAVFSPHRLDPPEDVWALPPEYKDRRSKLMVSRPGSWTAWVVTLPSEEQVTAISLYGLLDERSDASVHRSLSDLTPLFEDERYNELLLLGGDLNTLCTARAGSRRLARDQGILDRITCGFGLVDLLQQSLREKDPPRGPLKGCECSFGDECLHTWTYRKGESEIPYQDDYLFASPALAERRPDCKALDVLDQPDWPSEHAPIVAMFC